LDGLDESIGTIPRAVQAAADAFGSHVAVAESGGPALSYRDLLGQVRDVARALIASGIEPGDRVGFWSPNTHHWVVGALGALYAGATLVPVNTRFTAAEALDVIARSRARALFVAGPFLGADRHADLAAAVRPDDVSDILFTSGTTGRSKGAMSAHRQALDVARAWAERAGLTSADRYLIVNPFFHSFGYKAGILACLLSGATIYPQQTFDVAVAMRLIESERITVFPGAPTVYASILDHPDRPGRDLSSLRLAVTDAAVVPVSLVERMRAELSFETVLTAYGLTEAVVATMCSPGDDPRTVAGRRPHARWPAHDECEDLMGMRAGMDSTFGLHHVAHSHNAETGTDSLGGMNARTMKSAAGEPETPGR
jgi:HIP---CoA ligase